MANTKKKFSTKNKTIKSKYNSKIKRKNKKMKTLTNKKRKFKKNKVGGSSYKLQGSLKGRRGRQLKLVIPGLNTGTDTTIRRPATGIRPINPLRSMTNSLTQLHTSKDNPTEPPEYYKFNFRGPRTIDQKRNNAERFKNSILMQEVKVNPRTRQYTFRGFTAPNLDKLLSIISINSRTGQLMINSPEPKLPGNLKGFFSFDNFTKGPYSKTIVTQDGSKYTEV